jgi:integrase
MVRRPGFEPGLPDWQSKTATKTVNRYDFGARRSVLHVKSCLDFNFRIYTSKDKQNFTTWLQTTKHQEIDTAKNNASFVGTFIKSGKTAEDFVKSDTNPYTYNNALFAVNHWLDYVGKPRMQLKQKLCTPRNLIIAPKTEEMKQVISEIKDKHVQAYIALCATVGLRPKRLLKVTWQEIDFENRIVNINERHGKKVYRPNCLHQDVAKLLQDLPESNDRIFNFTYPRVVNAVKAIGTKWRPNNCRDFFYNYARKSGADRDQIEWLAGHSLPGVRAHYLADELKTEYAKFEQAFRLE